jgi:toxin-antitoxin system PIN domain toxin
VTRFLCDTNVWLAMSDRHHIYQLVASEWLGSVAETDRVLFCRSTQQSLLRLLTTPSVFAPYGSDPNSSAQAWDVFEQLLADSRVGFERHEPPGLEALWRRFTTRPSASPKLWMDAYLAAFAVAAGLRVVTTDSAFRQFEGLDVLVLT